MKEYILTPAVCTDRPAVEGDDNTEAQPARPATFTGTVTLRVPKYSERQEFRSVAVELNEDKTMSGSIGSIGKMVEMSKPFVLRTDLKHVDGTEFKTFEDMEYDPRCEEVLQECAMELMKGIIPSKK